MTTEPERGRQRAGGNLEVVGGVVAEEIEAVAAFGERDAFGVAVRVRLTYLGAVCRPGCAAAPARCRRVRVRAVDGAVEEIDDRPEQVLEVRFEARVAQSRDESVEDVRDGAGHGIAFGKRSWIGLVLEGTVAIKLKLVEDVIGRG